MKIDRLFKQNVMTLRRSSSPQQVDTSNVNQLRTMEEALRDSHVNIVSEVDLQGVTGSMPGNRTDINNIIARKRQLDDFKYLVLPCADRFTRSGSLHGQKMIWDLATAGITVYFVQEHIFSDSEMGLMQLSFLFDAARKQSSQTAKVSLEGQTYSFKDGKSPHTRLTPYGCDRLYLINGKPAHILRNMEDGTQEMWTPEENHADRTLIQTFQKNPKRGMKNHYQKQRNETVVLVPGDPERVATVIRIMRAVWVDGLGDRVVARQLNTEGIKSPRGSQWCTRSLYELARRPIYLGHGIRGRTKGGIYYKTNNNGAPLPANRTIQELATNNDIRNSRRRRDEWIERLDPTMENFLPPELREICRPGINDYLDRLADAPMKIEGRKTRIANSQYLLTSILRAKQGGYKMIGSGGAYPHYVSMLFHGTPQPSKTIFSKCFRLAPLHNAVLAILKEVLINRPDLKREIQRVLDQKRAEASGFSVPEAQDRVKALRARQIAMSRRIKGHEDADDPVFQELDDLDRQIAELRKQIDTAVASNVERPSAAVLHRQFMAQAAGFDTMDRPTIKAFLRQIITRMEADLETRDVEIDLTLPHWVSTGKIHPETRKPISFAESPSIASHQRRKTNDFRPNLFSFRLTRHGRGPDEHYTWTQINTSVPSQPTFQLRLAA